MRQEPKMLKNTQVSMRPKAKQLKKTITKQSSEISRLNMRVSELVDELFTVKSDVSAFKNAVSRDMQGLATEIQKHYVEQNK